MNDEMQISDHLKHPPEGEESYLVAVNDGPSAEYLIREAAAIGRREGAPLTVLHVQKPGKRLAPLSARVKLLSSVALEAGSEFVTATETNPGRGIARFAEEKRMTTVILGKTRRGFLPAAMSPVRDLQAAGLPFRVLLVSSPLVRKRKMRYFLPVIAYRFPLLDYIVALAATAAITGINLLLAPLVGYRTIALFYLLFVSFGALFLRVGPVVLAAILSALLWNFLFIPPLGTLSIAHFEDLFMFIVYIVLAVLIGGLTARLRVRDQLMQRGEKTISALYDLSRELGRSLDRDDIARVAVKYIDLFFKSRTAVLLSENLGVPKNPAGPAPTHLTPHTAGTLALSEVELNEAQGVFEHIRADARAAGITAASSLWFVPLGAGTNPAGVLVVKPLVAREPDPEIGSFLRGASSLIALALERDAYMRQSESARVSAESERLYKTLFNLVSHELRTPLTTIKGAASSLTDEAVDGRPETRHALYAEIKQAGDRLNRLLANILSMGRIESGFLKLDRRYHDLHDLATAALAALEEDLAGRKVSIEIPDDLPSCRIDFDFMRQVFVNLLHNAYRYAGPGARITISAKAEETGVVIRCTDDGPGFHPEAGQELFDKFRRGSRRAAGGLGLGLSICRGIVEAHGGTIAATNANSGGAEITITLPDCLAPRSRAGRET
jgi:two-component system sensor histidine kinase KdpD